MLWYSDLQELEKNEKGVRALRMRMSYFALITLIVQKYTTATTAAKMILKKTLNHGGLSPNS